MPGPSYGTERSRCRRSIPERSRTGHLDRPPRLSSKWLREAAGSRGSGDAEEPARIGFHAEAPKAAGESEGSTARLRVQKCPYGGRFGLRRLRTAPAPCSRESLGLFQGPFCFAHLRLRWEQRKDSLAEGSKHPSSWPRPN